MKMSLRRLRQFPVIVSFLFLLTNVSLGDIAMNPKVVQEAEFTVVGIAIRTSNAKEMTPAGVIGRQWTRLMRERVLAKIRNKADNNTVAVYTDYASDQNGEYTYVLGARVTSEANIPTGMVAKKVPAGRYAVFTSEKGAAAKVVPEAWGRINSLPKSAVGGDRIYRTDFEIYDDRAADPQNSQVDVYIGIK
jgi:predicted transcriptional regulator YdeE